MKGSVTLKDIAKECGVSTATVSRALSGTGYVKSEVKEMIAETANRLGYVTNFLNDSLKASSSGLIGYITSDISNQYHISVAKGIESVISAKNYNLIVCSSNGDASIEMKYIRSLLSRNIDALIINPTCRNNVEIARLSHRLPVVSVNRRIENPNFCGDFVDADNRSGIYALTQYLAGAGHRRIYFIGGPPEFTNACERYEGFRSAMAEIGINVNPSYEYQYQGDFSEQSGYDAIIYMIGHFSIQPTAIIASNNALCIGALKALYAQGLSVPEDYSVSCFNSINNSELFKVQPSVTDHSPVMIGQVAGRFALERILDNTRGKQERIITPRLIPGNGVRSIPALIEGGKT